MPPQRRPRPDMDRTREALRRHDDELAGEDEEEPEPDAEVGEDESPEGS
jgi:hypothetical protein